MTVPMEPPRFTRQENEMLTRVGPGTPMGDLLRRYWLPVGISADVQDRPTFIRVLGEDLVLFRGKGGRVGLLGAYCSHRRANLCLGSIVGDALRCRYHGFTWDAQGRLVYVPKEVPDPEGYMASIRQLAYPVQELGGIIFAYLGPQPAPLLPRYQFLAGDGERHVKITGIANSNWLQCVENGMDPLHVSYTHGTSLEGLEVEPDMVFEETPWGLVHKAFRPARDGRLNAREHHLLFPGISCGGTPGRYLEGSANTPAMSARWSVPIDDTTTLIVRCTYKPADNPGRFLRDPLPPAWKAVTIEPYKEYRNRREDGTVTLGYAIPKVVATEDATLIDSLGPIVERDKEYPHARGDYGMIVLRRMYLREMERVRQGKDPAGTIRDPADNALIEIPAYERWLTVDEYARMKKDIQPLRVQA